MPVEANVRAFLLAMGRAGGGVERDDGEVVWTVGGSPIGYHNAVVACAVDPARADEVIEQWAGELDHRGVPGSWHLSPSMRPADLAARLVAHGFEDGGEEPAMVADLGAPVPRLPPVAGLVVDRVRTTSDLDAYRDVLAAGFGAGPPEATWATEVFGRIGLGDGAWRHLLGRLGGAPVATATVFVEPAHVAGIYFVCTAPAARRRGVGAAVTAAALQEARAMGCVTSVLGSSPMGYRVYRRLGFEEVFRYRLLERESGASQRTTSSRSPVSTS